MNKNRKTMEERYQRQTMASEWNKCQINHALEDCDRNFDITMHIDAAGGIGITLDGNMTLVQLALKMRPVRILGQYKTNDSYDWKTAKITNLKALTLKNNSQIKNITPGEFGIPVIIVITKQYT